MLAPLHPRHGLLKPEAFEALRGSPSGLLLFFVVEIAWPSGTGRYAKADVASASQGLYKGKLRKTGTYEYAVSDRQFRLESQTPEVEFLDSDFEVADLVRAGGIYGSAVTVRCAVGGVPFAAWPVVFSGIVADWGMVEPLVWRVQFRYDDAPLLGNVPRDNIPKYDFPHADPAVFAGTAPLVYGFHDSTGVGDDGMVPLPLVDNTRPDYLAARASVTILDEYADKVKVTPVGGSVDYPLPNGRMYTLVEGDKLSPAVPVGSTKAITADVRGYNVMPFGDAPFVQILDPTTEIKHVLVNFAFNNYGSERTWFDDSTAPVHVGWFAYTKGFLDARGYRASRRIASQRTALEVLEEWCHNHQVYAFWTMDGLLAVRPEDDTNPVVYYDYPRVVWWETVLGPLSLDYETEDVVKEVIANYLWHESAGAFQFSLRVVDQNAPFEASETMDLYWSQSKVD